MKDIWFAVAAIVASLPGMGAAQGSSVTVSTLAYPRTQDGKRVGCIIEFKQLVEDWTYSRGAQVLVSGSIGLMNYPGKVPAVTMKLVLGDMADDSTKPPQRTAPPIAMSLVGADGESNAGSRLTTMAGDDPGSLLAVFSADDSFAQVYRRIALQNQLAFLFNRRAGGADMRVVVDLGVQDATRRSEATRKDFMACTRMILRDMEAQSAVIK